MKHFLSLLLFLVLISCMITAPKTDDSTQIIDQFVNQIKNDLKDDNINGSIAVAVIKNRNVLSADHFGYITPEKEKSADTTTIYRIGSITKSFTAFLLIKLAEQGILNLNDPVELYLPEIKDLTNYKKYEPITLKQLASHTSGIERESRNREANFGSIKDWEQKVLHSIKETTIREYPGKQFSYSNIGYAILGLAISKAAHVPYIDLVHQEILSPLKMNNTYFKAPKNKVNNIAIGMGGGPTVELDLSLPLREHQGRGYRVPNGGMYSSLNDLIKFMKACMGQSQIINKNSLVKLQTSQTPTKRMRANYSYGFELYETPEIKTIGHSGSTPGYSSHFEFEKNSNYGVILLRNYNFGNTNLDLRPKLFN